MNKLRLGIDCDGIVSDFNVSYKALIEQEFPHIKVPDINDTYPNTWGYDKALGLLNKDITHLWQTIEGLKDFWLNIPAYSDANGFLRFLRDLELFADADVYFVTSRPGLTSKTQTEKWLQQHGFNGYPTVLISSKKGAIAKALKLTHYLDDRNENCVDAYETSPKTKVYMLARAWNEEQTDIPRLASLTEFQEEIRKELNG